MRNRIGLQKYNSYSTAFSTYEQKVDAFNAEQEEQYNRDLSVWDKNACENIQLMQNHLNETQKILDELYSRDFIYPKYRCLPALASIYEYFQIGRVEELTGPHGAYNLYEDEIRKDKIIAQLNTVIENLEQIKNSQYILYEQAKIIAENTSAMRQEISQIKVYTQKITELSAISAYYSALIERNTSISSTCHIMNG